MRARSSAPLSSIGGRRAGARACVRSCFFILLPTVLVGVHFRPCCFLLGRRRCRRRRNCYYYYVPSSFFTASPAEAVAAAAAFVRSFARRSVGRSGELATFSFFLLQRRFSSTWPNKRASGRGRRRRKRRAATHRRRPLSRRRRCFGHCRRRLFPLGRTILSILEEEERRRRCRRRRRRRLRFKLHKLSLGRKREGCCCCCCCSGGSGTGGGGGVSE